MTIMLLGLAKSLYGNLYIKDPMNIEMLSNPTPEEQTITWDLLRWSFHCMVDGGVAAEEQIALDGMLDM